MLHEFVRHPSEKAETEFIATLDTPCLLLDEGRLDANLQRLHKHLAVLGVGLRPHLKTAKSIDVARRVLPTPTGPATVSTLKEAEVFARAGIADMIYALGMAPAKLERIVALRRGGVDIAVIPDSLEQARAVCDASRVANIRIPALIEIDCDGHRSKEEANYEGDNQDFTAGRGGGLIPLRYCADARIRRDGAAREPARGRAHARSALDDADHRRDPRHDRL